MLKKTLSRKSIDGMKQIFSPQEKNNASIYNLKNVHYYYYYFYFK